MSTEIKQITGRFEGSHGKDFKVHYWDSMISLTRFAGGKENGAMIQVTISNSLENAYIQLTKEQVMELSETLKDSYDYDKYPSE